MRFSNTSGVPSGTIKRYLLLVLVTTLLVCRGLLSSTATSPTPVLASPQTIAAQTNQYLSDLSTEAGFNGSVLMAPYGEILLSGGYGGAARDRHILNIVQTKFRLGSLAKQFTAMAILIL